MALNSRKVKSENNDNSDYIGQPVLEIGGYPARIVQIIDLGVQKRPDFDGKAKKPWQHVRVTYELAEEFMLDTDETEESECDYHTDSKGNPMMVAAGEELTGKPRWVSEDFPFFGLDVDNAGSTKRYKALDPKEIHDGMWDALLGQPCVVNIVHGKGKGKNKGRVFENVSGISAMTSKKAEKAPELVNESLYFEMDAEYIEEFMSFPKWLQDKIKGAVDYEDSDFQDAVDSYIKPEEDSNEKESKKKAKAKKAKKAEKEVEEEEKPKPKKAKKPKKKAPEPEEEEDVPFEEDEEEDEDEAELEAKLKAAKAKKAKAKKAKKPKKKAPEPEPEEEEESEDDDDEEWQEEE